MEKFEYSADHPSLKDASRDEHVGPGGANYGNSHCFSPSSRSIFPNRYPGELEYDSKNTATIHRVMHISEVDDWTSHLKQDLMLNGKDHEEYILQLRKHLADCLTEEAQVLDEEYTLDKHIAYMGMDPHGTVCLFVILRTGVVIAVDSRSSLGINVKRVLSDKELKFRRVGDQNPPVIVTVAGNKDRSDFLLRELERDPGGNIIEEISVRCQQILGDVPQLMEDRCYLLLAGYSERKRSFLVISGGDTMEPKQYDSAFQCGAIGSGAPFALPKLEKWVNQWRDKLAGPEEIFSSAIITAWTATLDSTFDDPACGGIVRVIWITEAWFDPRYSLPIPLMCQLRPDFENSLFFFTRSSHDGMNYDKLEGLLVAGGWLPRRRGVRGESPPPACLGVAGGATVFLVRFEEEDYDYRYFFRECRIIPGFEQHPFYSCLHLRKVVYDDQELLVCVKEYRLLGKIADGTISLPW